ncbi:bifunctional serine/threonine-protein kinase/formylglycine-generating enzyme family protein [Candidatus Uabimicrobium amorphum]|uniref:non-specific serine/threonine protein kinase n=1 Tax=Uabimicrobium amorphum TaxID=2596890 RepID=A0A5S9F710_UABAM|nr:bifunctional serine/threonine-protein kinase/formylglycine-generating enzyme family protein [Candidatus Uabimicrobium amorphum]BBM86772.1 protein kinase [Candidatus Uabimicrobium amorphum]
MTINNNPPCFLKSPDGKQQVGPYTFHQVYQYYANGKVKTDHLMSLDRNSWHNVGQVFASQDAMRRFIQSQQATVFTDDNIVLGQEDKNNLDSFCALFESNDEPQKVDTLIASSVENQDDGIFGDYEILGELGRGGMGVVYKVEHRHMKRTMALKVLLTESASDKDVKRFVREAKLTAALMDKSKKKECKNIVEIYHYGETPAPHIAMEYVEGQTLGDFLRKKRGRLSEREAAKLFLQICEGLTYAHEKEVLHRDLKPGNILINNEGVAKVMDFGLAKPFSLEEDEALSVKGELIGTPQYMSPEQASTKKELDHRSDIYSLGAIFYEMLCGNPPFKGEGNTLSLLFKIIREKITPLKEIKPDIHEDLHLITMKCLEKDRDNRYRRCRHIVQDLRKFLKNQPISLRPPGLWERVVVKVREEKKLVLAVAVAMSIMFVFVGLGTLIRVEQQNAQAEKQYMEQSARFHNRDFTTDFSQCVKSNKGRVEYLWIQGIVHLINGRITEAQKKFDDVWSIKVPAGQEKNKLIILRTTCAVMLKNNEKAKKIFAGYNKKYLVDLTVNEFTRTTFNVASYREDFSREKARYFLIISLLQKSQSAHAYGNLLFNKSDVEDAVARDLTRKYYNVKHLLDSPTPWIKSMMDTAQITFLEMQDIICQIGGVWLCDMRSAYWSHLPPNVQGQYASFYQKAYAKSIGKSVLRTENIASCDFKFSLIPPGYFRIGDPHSTFEDGPAFDHYFEKHFWILQNEVTQNQWVAVMKRLPKAYQSSNNKVEKDLNAPVTQFTYQELGRFFSKSKFELPHEIQWEYACRSGTTSKWFWKKYGEKSNIEKQYLLYEGYDQLSMPIRFKIKDCKENSWGLYQVSGNASELCSNVYIKYRQLIRNKRFTSNYKLRLFNSQKDRKVLIVMRGGYLYADSPEHCSSSSRINITIGQLNDRPNFLLGFRLLMSE